MAPPSKKPKLDATTALLPDAPSIRKESLQLLADLTNTLDTVEESSPTESAPLLNQASLAMLNLKHLQNRLVQNILQMEETLKQQAIRRDQQELKLQNLEYQQRLHDHAIQTCQNLPTDHLMRLCRSSKPIKAEEKSSIAKDDPTQETQLLQDFLGVDPKDPVNHAIIMDKLDQQLRARQKLQNQLKQWKEKASQSKQLLQEKQKALQDLPKKLAAVEKASLPLQQFCKDALPVQSNQVSTERSTSLDLAKRLPAPLYTLYYQLQSTMDHLVATGQFQEGNLGTLEVNKQSSMILWKLPSPTLDGQSSTSSTSRKKSGTIQFKYNETNKLVSAHSSSVVDLSNILQELFPGDVDTTNKNTTDSKQDGDERHAYHWCNYLAGILKPPASQETPNITTAAILRAVLLKIEA